MITATGGLIGLVLGSLAAVVLVLVIITTAGRTIRNRRERRQAARVERARPQLYALVDGDETEIDPTSLETIDTLVLAMLPRLRGADRESLRGWLSDRGILSRSRQRLHSRRPVLRAESAELLGGAGDLDSHYDIRELLYDPDPRVRICAARSIGRLGDASSAAALISAYRSPDRPISRGIVGMAILRMGAPVTPQLREELSSSDPLVRALCAELLGHLGDIEAVSTLIDTIENDPDAVVRSAAARALGRIGSPDATARLLALLATESAEVRLAAAWAIGAIGDPTAATVLVESLHDVDVDVAATAARVVAELSPDLLRELDCCPSAMDHAHAALSMLQLDGSLR